MSPAEGGKSVKKVALFAFNGEPMCFVHVLLNALDMKEKGYEVKIVIEGSATKLVPELAGGGNPVASLYRKAADQGLIEGACRACSGKMGVQGDIKSLGLTLLDDMSGHPGMASYRDLGFAIISF